MMAAGFLALVVGDHVAASAGPESLVAPGRPRWHALRCLPQREDAAEAWLARRGVYAFHPVTRRRTVRYGKPVEIARRYLPGYVFARFPGVALRHRVEECPMLTGAVRLASGEWGCLDPFGLRSIIAMRKVDEAARRADRRRRREARQLRVGDRALMLGGVFGEKLVEIAEIDGGEVRFRVAMFGGVVLASASAGELVKIGT